jgi:hypothetical protein
MKNMSLAEIKTAVEQLSPKEFADLMAFLRERDRAEWDRQIDEDFAEDGRLRPVLDEVREDLHAGRVEELP